MQDGALLAQAFLTLGYLQRQLGQRLGVSTRTVQRWYAGQGSPSNAQWQELAKDAYLRHPDLAARFARQGGSSVEELGLVAPPAPASGSRDLEPIEHLADGVVCVAAEAIDVTPRAIRPALLAAFRRARQMRLTVEDIEGALAKPEPRKTRRKA